MTVTVVLALVGVALAAGAALAGPRVLAALPPSTTKPAEGEETPPTYAELGRREGLGPRLAIATGLIGVIVAVGLLVDDQPGGDLIVWLPLLPIGVLLAYVDWQTKLLPRQLVWVGTAWAMLAATGWGLVGDQRTDLLRALIGLVGAGFLFGLAWFIYPAGMGFGDVRLSLMLGAALGWLGPAELMIGLYAGFLLNGLPGVAIAIWRRDRSQLKRAYPFGPALLAGSVVGIWVGPLVNRWLMGG